MKPNDNKQNNKRDVKKNKDEFKQQDNVQNTFINESVIPKVDKDKINLNKYPDNLKLNKNQLNTINFP